MGDKVLFIPRLAKEIDKVIALAEKEEEMKKYKDLVVVVRCVMCKHFDVDDDEEVQVGMCWEIGTPTVKDFYCAYGERRKDES